MEAEWQEACKLWGCEEERHSLQQCQYAHHRKNYGWFSHVSITSVWLIKLMEFVIISLYSPVRELCLSIWKSHAQAVTEGMLWRLSCFCMAVNAHTEMCCLLLCCSGVLRKSMLVSGTLVLTRKTYFYVLPAVTSVYLHSCCSTKVVNFQSNQN